MANLTVPDLNFNYVADKTKYFKAFCVNPAEDHCNLGLCPNTDVTGIGQQVSIYITTIIYAMVLAYIPWLHRPMLYAHMSVLYSLYIAALVSMLKGELTNADGIFVVVTAGSPASIYLWYLTLRSFWNANVFPIQHANKSVPAHKSLEVQLTRAIVLGSFFFEIALICLMFIPSKAIKFSQPACNKEFGTALWYNVAWELPVAIQSVAMLILFLIALGLTRLWAKRRAYEVPAPMLQPLSKDIEEKPTTERKDNIDIISWTEQVLFDCYPQFMNRTLFICLITVVQLSALPDFEYFVNTKDCLTIILVTFGLFREMPHTSRFKIFVLRICFFIFLAGVWVIRFLGIEFPNSADWIIFFVGCTSALWSWSHFSTSNMKIFLPTLLVLFSMIITTANIFITIIGDPKSFSDPGFAPPDGNYFSFFSLDVLTVVLWIICWLGTSNWPWGKSLTWDKFNKAIWRRAHLLKFCWIILGPHILWIQASNNSNPSRSTDMTFGQIFALIVSIVTVLTLLDEAREMKKEMWAAFFQSDLMPYEEKEQPKHYVPRPGLGMS
ncbi:hypothetical protein EST38_g6020 [Candolleomyces aberdarensis]|uniref:Uncharacterized protein n=1 Tax=Candolleomyces aberdarensis TaxID=2316362 RepID=A0A4Q2DIV9_9AGAR|nr:hypothetical protein EST38_g6020 [Candolleomyces aberdarensis]